MSSQEAVHVSLMEVMPTSGKGTLGTWWFHFQRGGRTQSRHKPTHELELSYEQTIRRSGRMCTSASTSVQAGRFVDSKEGTNESKSYILARCFHLSGIFSF